MSIKSILHTEIEDEFKELAKIETGTESYKVAVDGLTKLMDRKIEMDKIEIESQDKAAAMEMDTALKRQQMEEDRKDRKTKNVLTGLGIAVPTAAAIWGTIKSIKFEETGSITTIMGRGWISKLLPKK